MTESGPRLVSPKAKCLGSTERAAGPGFSENTARLRAGNFKVLSEAEVDHASEA